jgi:sulfate adenylyltransferase
MSLVPPHGGQLVDRTARGAAREALLQTAAKLPTITLNAREEADLELIANGAFSPLEGFLGEKDYLSVRDNKRLANGLVWSIPVTLSASEEEIRMLTIGEDVALHGRHGRLLAVLHLTEIYRYDQQKEAEQVYRTTEDKHPGVAALYALKDYLLGGKITLLNEVNPNSFANYRFTPRELRALFAEKGWRHVVAFQTRNPIHRAHEYMTKTALESVDALLVHPIIGETKSIARKQRRRKPTYYRKGLFFMSQGFTLWFTGLSGAGKTTLTNEIVPQLKARGVKVEVLDGDEVRTNLSKGLGFSKEDRDANIRRNAT